MVWPDRGFEGTLWPHTRGETELEFGCLWPVALVLAVAIAVGVVVGMRLQPGPSS